MAIRVRHTVVVRTARDTDFNFAMWDPDVSLSEQVLDTFEKQANGNFDVAVTSIATLPLDPITAVKGLYLETDIACKVRLNGSLDSIELTPASPTVPAKLFVEANISQVEVENESASVTLNGVFVIWGDPTP